jgi:hypothetical protein
MDSTLTAPSPSVSSADVPELMTPKEVAALLRCTVAALSQLRYRDEGPTYISIGRKILYRREDIRIYLKQNETLAGRR